VAKKAEAALRRLAIAAPTPIVPDPNLLSVGVAMTSVEKFAAHPASARVMIVFSQGDCYGGFVIWMVDGVIQVVEPGCYLMCVVLFKGIFKVLRIWNPHLVEDKTGRMLSAPKSVRSVVGAVAEAKSEGATNKRYLGTYRKIWECTIENLDSCGLPGAAAAGMFEDEAQARNLFLAGAPNLEVGDAGSEAPEERVGDGASDVAGPLEVFVMHPTLHLGRVPPCALCRPNVDAFVPQTQHVNLRVVCQCK